MIGQINIDSEAGKWIHSISSQKDVFNIVEIGTWNGAGSTNCVYQAIKETTKSLISLEINFEMHKHAMNFYKNKNEVKLLLGKITDELISLENLNELFFKDYSFEIKNSWRNQDLLNLKKCKNVLHLIPEKIDFLILDGGEFSSLAEFNILKNRSSFIFLDDVRPPTIKNYLAREELLKVGNLVFENLNDRNGYSIFKL